MGIDLSIAVCENGGSTPLAYTRFRLQWRHPAFFDKISKASKPLGLAVWWYNDEGIVKTENDAYDNPLTWIAARELWVIMDDVPLHAFDSAVKEFIGALPMDQPIILYWC